MPLLAGFDPWRSSLCTCPPKLTFNPYTGCGHNCLYCYATSYVKNHADCHPKKDFLKTLRREASKLHGETVSLSYSSDPYPPLEATEKLTRHCLEVLAQSDCRIQIVTKSSLAARDIDLLQKAPASVAFTVTTLDDQLAGKLEPNAPPPSLRIKAAAALSEAGVPVSARIDPIILGLNDQPQQLIEALTAAAVKHITASTYKAKPDSWLRLAKVFPEEMAALKPLYYERGMRAGGSVMLPRELRLKLLGEVGAAVAKAGMCFGVCREGLSELNTAPCDGSWLLPKLEAKQCRIA